jgi:hypothetical protein
MRDLSDEEKARYFHRSYTAVDGLWFVKVEERRGFEEAFRVDHDVWAVMAKIQARTLKAIMGLDQGIEALRDCFSAKLSLDDFTFRVVDAPGGRGFTIIAARCPWHDLRLRSGRAGLFEKCGHLICQTEYEGWAAEFGSDIRFTLGTQLCRGEKACVLEFRCTSCGEPEGQGEEGT